MLENLVRKIAVFVFIFGLSNACASSKPTQPAASTQPAEPPVSQSEEAPASSAKAADGCDNLAGIEQVVALADFELIASDKGPEELARSARIIPQFFPDETVEGFKLLSVRPNSVMARLGLRWRHMKSAKTRGRAVRAASRSKFVGLRR